MSADGRVQVELREVGPRDGLQMEPMISWDDKVKLFEAIASTGVQRVEATSFVSPRAVPSMADADQVAELVTRWPHIEFSALAVNARGVSRAVEAGFGHVEFVVSAADGHSVANAGRPTLEVLRQLEPAVEIAHEAEAQIELVVATSWDCPFDGRVDPSTVLHVVRAGIDAGVDALCIADTIGSVTPGRVAPLLDEVRMAASCRPISCHFHNTRGSGLASAWEALRVGITRLDASVAGLGGCPFAPGASGNIATEELVHLLQDSQYETGIELEASLRAARVAADAVGHGGQSQVLRAGGAARPVAR